jgi:hypothetical protein
MTYGVVIMTGETEVFGAVLVPTCDVVTSVKVIAILSTQNYRGVKRL